MLLFRLKIITTLVNAANPYDLAIDEVDQLLFWTDNRNLPEGQVWSLPTAKPDGIASLAISTANAVDAITIGTSKKLLFYTVPLGMLISRAASTYPTMLEDIYTMLGPTSTDLVVEGETLYWAEDTTVHRIGNAAGTPVMVYEGIGLTSFVRGLDVDYGKIYATIGDNGNGAIVSIDEDTLGVTQEETEPNPTHILSDGVNLYWTGNSSDDCQAGVGFIRTKVSGPSGKAQIMAGSLPCLSNLVAYGKYIYWGAGTKIYRAPIEI
jgi:hypothetical protein